MTGARRSLRFSLTRRVVRSSGDSVMNLVVEMILHGNLREPAPVSLPPRNKRPPLKRGHGKCLRRFCWTKISPTDKDLDGFLGGCWRLCVFLLPKNSHIWYMDVSENNGTPKSSILIGFFIIFTIHLGYPQFLETPIYVRPQRCSTKLGPWPFLARCFFLKCVA